MADRSPSGALNVLHYSGRDYATYAALAVAIWLTGVAIVRILGSAAFDPDEPWPSLLFVASIGLGIGTQLAAPFLTRLPATQTLVPIIVICGFALVLDGLAIAFTDIYSSDLQTKVLVGGWLLWTFGTQIIISLVMVGKTLRQERV